MLLSSVFFFKESSCAFLSFLTYKFCYNTCVKMMSKHHICVSNWTKGVVSTVECGGVHGGGKDNTDEEQFARNVTDVVVLINILAVTVAAETFPSLWFRSFHA